MNDLRIEPLRDDHALETFSCGENLIDVWLRRHAIKNQTTGASRTFVAVTASERVVGFYSLASGNIAATVSTGRFRRNMPDPIPVVVLGRLAVDTEYQGRGISRIMVGDAILRTAQAADILGIRGIVVHALRPDLNAFYTALGFTQPHPTTNLLMITLSDALAAINAHSE
ncbi:MAG: GNAT family N-acetyltransferase [Propionibacteriaceae bacterium]|jgi:predicted N-acetyltransferase YhbS|nr:GNAT family N-acetyltransferase [Propionibacteriaceae bacterium]